MGALELDHKDLQKNINNTSVCLSLAGRPSERAIHVRVISGCMAYLDQVGRSLKGTAGSNSRHQGHHRVHDVPVLHVVRKHRHTHSSGQVLGSSRRRISSSQTGYLVRVQHPMLHSGTSVRENGISRTAR